jgi:hypothetical protein
MSDERRMTDLERYLSYKRVLERPTFNSIEQAEREMRAHDGEFRRFVVREPLGMYSVCYCFISHDREGNESWAYNEEYRFSHCDMLKYRDRAALAVGIELVESM